MGMIREVYGKLMDSAQPRDFRRHRCYVIGVLSAQPQTTMRLSIKAKAPRRKAEKRNAAAATDASTSRRAQ